MIETRLAVESTIKVLKKSLKHERTLNFTRLNEIMHEFLGVSFVLSSLYQLEDLKEEVDLIIEGLREKLLQHELQKIGRGGS